MFECETQGQEREINQGGFRRLLPNVLEQLGHYLHGREPQQEKETDSRWSMSQLDGKTDNKYCASL